MWERMSSVVLMATSTPSVLNSGTWSGSVTTAITRATSNDHLATWHATRFVASCPVVEMRTSHRFAPASLSTVGSVPSLATTMLPNSSVAVSARWASRSITTTSLPLASSARVR